MTGTDLQHHLMGVGYCKPIILMSALSIEEARSGANETLSCRFLRKPFSADRLIECLDWALRDAYVKAPPTQPADEEYSATRFLLPVPTTSTP